MQKFAFSFAKVLRMETLPGHLDNCHYVTKINAGKISCNKNFAK